MQLQPICIRLERLHGTLQSREELLAKLDASAFNVEAVLGRLKSMESQNSQLLSEKANLEGKVGLIILLSSLQIKQGLSFPAYS